VLFRSVNEIDFFEFQVHEIGYNVKRLQNGKGDVQEVLDVLRHKGRRNGQGYDKFYCGDGREDPKHPHDVFFLERCCFV
jgi:hypothetical protein